MSKRATKITKFNPEKNIPLFYPGYYYSRTDWHYAYVLYWLFERVDGILRPAVFAITGVNIPGIGFVIILLFVILVGWISSNFLMGSAINFFDQLMERTPGVKFIYSSTKDFFEAFAGDKKRFNKAVLANVFSEDVWIIGFLNR